MRYKGIVLSIASTLMISACSSSPTGRNQVVLFSDTQMSSLGQQSFSETKNELPISKDTKINAYVQCVTNAILDYVPIQGSFSQWEVVVFDSPQVNAFALPGGKIGVYTGLLDVAVNQDQLATVIGHEIAHVLADHSNERMSHAHIANTGLQISNIALASQDYRNEIMALMGVGVQYGVLLPYGRTQESEADVVGLELMAKAGFDPYQSVELWKNMAKASGGSHTPELLSTHPSHDTRINELTDKARRLPAFSGTKPNCAKPV
ncbi:peptidase M48 family protein [Vibrio halioticoli NBRC 102217]|uniref:Peptidase M48 family protein n=1 Tax=Vibrio halioticoli NBRC 102217 TaxID=1219072 RepID=V5FH83_9VIBR|nr:M48 family metallopeptidase [Vibrio halioticoli]GAD91103.1 peptidase M48 family protein [Vibrio halioticoli NBRC 102217]